MRAQLPIMIAAALAAHVAHTNLEPPELSLELRDTLPSEEALQLMSLGYANIVADYYWMRAISHFGTRGMHEADYPNLEPLLRRVLALDPYFASAYLMAGTALTVQGQDFSASTELLKKGMIYRPDDWHIPFYLGFNAFQFEGDYHTAAWAMAQAARLPEAPPMAGPLATRLAAEANEPQIGLEMIDAVIETITNPKLKEVYEERRLLLMLEVELDHLEHACSLFVKRYGRSPRRLDELVQPGILRGVPDQDPLGGTYFLDAEGRVQSTNDSRRLRLPKKAKRLLH